MNATDVEYTLEWCVELLNKVQTKHGNDTIIFVGGDFNHKSINSLLVAFPALIPFRAGATRNGAALEEVYTNMDHSIVEKKIQSPLRSIEGIESDHSIITASLKFPRQVTAVKTTFNFRPITTDGVDKFGSLLANMDWDSVKGISSTESARKLDACLRDLVEQCFPEKSRTIRSTDAPWFNSAIKKAGRKKIRL